MNLYETEALTLESRRAESTAADLFFVFFYSLPIWVYNVHGAFFFYGESLSFGKRIKQARRRNKNIVLLNFIHFMLEPVEALLQQDLHMNTLRGTRRRQEGRERLLAIVLQLMIIFMIDSSVEYYLD